MENSTVNKETFSGDTKFCKYCGAKIPKDAVLCTICGRQVEEMHNVISQPNIVINNANSNTNQNTVIGNYTGVLRNKWVAIILCVLLGVIGAHKFYEGKVGMGILYIFTVGLFGIGVIIDFITLLFKPNQYYV